MKKSITLSSLVKVFSDEAPKSKMFSSMSMLKNERVSFQIAVYTDEDFVADIFIKSDLAESLHIYAVEEIHSDLPLAENMDDYTLRNTAGEYPDLLRPIEDNKILFEGGKWKSIWIEIDPNSKAQPGCHEINVILSEKSQQILTETFTVKIIDALLPEQDLICTNWFHTDCLSTWYNVEVFSEEYWKIVENFARTAVRHGINFLLTPLFTPPLDTDIGAQRLTVQLVKVIKKGENYTFNFDNLKRWVDMCDRCSVKYFEMSHLFTQWGAKHAPKIMAEVNGQEQQIFGWKTRAGASAYKNFLTQFAKALVTFIDDNSIRERCIFHVSDEPGKNCFKIYQNRSLIIEELFPGFKVIDAMSDYCFVEKGVCKIPVPANNAIDEFIGKVPELWTYYCCGQGDHYVSNKFFSMPSQRNRVLGVQMYNFNVKGFLQWGYNFWYSQLSKEKIDPFKVSDAGGKFPSGDAYSVYPGEDGEPLISLRLKVFYDAIQDYRALKLLESYIGREKSMQIIGENLESPLTFSQYPHSDEWQLELRERINSEIEKSMQEQL